MEGQVLLSTGRTLGDFTLRQACAMMYSHASLLTADQVRMRDYIDNAVYEIPIPSYNTDRSDSDQFDEAKQRFINDQEEKYGEIPTFENTDPDLPVDDPSMLARLDELDW